MENTSVALTNVDVVVRYAIGTALIGSVLIHPETPDWFALVATYPVFTAMLRLDPVYNLIAALGRTLAKPAWRRAPLASGSA